MELERLHSASLASFSVLPRKYWNETMASSAGEAQARADSCDHQADLYAALSLATRFICKLASGRRIITNFVQKLLLIFHLHTHEYPLQTFGLIVDKGRYSAQIQANTNHNYRLAVAPIKIIATSARI